MFEKLKTILMIKCMWKCRELNVSKILKKNMYLVISRVAIGAEDVAPRIGCLPSIHEALGLNLSTFKPGVVVQVCNPIILVLKTR